MTNVTLAAMLGGWEILVVLTVVFILTVVPVAVVGFVVYFVLRRDQSRVAPIMPVAPAAAVPKSPLQPMPVDKTEVVTRKCPQCGAELKPDVPEGLCPACLLQCGIATEGGVPPDQPPFVPPPVAELAKLFPQLEIFECLGRGGMGAVYKARQPRLDRLIALKILAPEKQSDPQFAERFEREARALAKLSHPDIVAVYDFGEVEGRFYLLMEFVDGLSLRQLLQAGKVKPEQALTIVPKICEALQFAHEHGIVHRDIKPENILLDKSGRVKIADFGIAKMAGLGVQGLSLTGAKDVVGTPHYMAPEQIEKPQSVDHRADIYSLGVVFYEMLTGELPLGKFAPPSLKVQIDVRLDEVVLRTLEKEPERRYQHASEVKTRVETIARSENDQPQAVAPVNQWSWTTALFNPFACLNGNRALLAGLTAILLAGLIGSVSHTHFDGVLDTHTGAAVPLWFFLSEGLVDWLCLGIVLLPFGKIVSKTPFRVLDLLGTQALARWPTILLGLITLPGAFQRFSNSLVEQFRRGGQIDFNTPDAIVFFAAIIAMIPLLCWLVWLMYKSYSVSCNLKGGRAIATFIPAIILAEVLSKLVLYWLWKLI